MSKTIKKFETTKTYTWQDGSEHSVKYSLDIMDWGEPNIIAYSFNDYEEEFCKLFVEALKEYKSLKFVTGVTGSTMNDIMQTNVTRYLKNEFGDKLAVKAGTGRNYDTLFRLND